MIKKWNIKEPDSELIRKISNSLNISPLVALVLINRGIKTPEKADFFLSADLGHLYSPFLMKDMHRAVERVIKAVTKKEKICICGDYDVDGITATSVMILFLRNVRADVSFYIPDRENGYGLNVESIKKLRQEGTKLIITVDSGVSDHEQICFAMSSGLDVIVTDHHEPPDVLPPAYAVINPRQKGCVFPFKGLAGVGVAFNFVMALRKTFREKGFWEKGGEPNLKRYLDLVALGTIADVVPMVDENRILVRNGLEIISEGQRPGIKALKLISGISDGKIMSHIVAYRLAPRLNAPGRLAAAKLAVDLLLCSNDEQAMVLARKVDELNIRRQQVERKTLSEARKMIPKEEDLPHSLVLFSPNWNHGVMGLCASRLTDEFCRPAIMISIDEEKACGRGSARSINGFDLYSALKKCSSWLTAFGGHKAAAGLTVPIDNLKSFIKQFNEITGELLQAGSFEPALNIDARISLKQLSEQVLEQLELLPPFGPFNPEPVFSSNELSFFSSMIVGKGHLKLKIKEDGRFFDAIGFKMAESHGTELDKIQLAFVPQFNFYNGEKTIQLNLKDIREV